MTCPTACPARWESLSHLEQCEPIKDMLGSFIRAFVAVKRKGVRDLFRRDQPLGTGIPCC